MARFMALDMLSPYIGLAIGAGIAVLLIRTRGLHLFLLALFVCGGILSAFAAYLAGYFALEAAGLAGTKWIFAPAVLGLIVWAVLFARLFARHTSSPRRNPLILP